MCGAGDDGVGRGCAATDDARPRPFLRGRQKQIMYDVAVSIRSFGCKQLLFNGSS